MKKLVYSSILLLNFLFISCQTEQKSFSRSDFEKDLNLCLSDKSFSAIGNFKAENKKSYDVRTNYNLQDTLIIKGITFFINPVKNQLSKEKPIEVQLSYPDHESAKFNLTYTPSSLYQLRVDLKFLNKDNNWDLVDKNSVVADGEFK